MLFDKMTAQQIYEEIRKDCYMLIPKIKQFYNLYKRDYQNKTKRNFDYKSTRGNNYHIEFYYKYGVVVFRVTTFINTNFGKKYILITLNQNNDTINFLMILDPHVFRRYKEREIKENITDAETISQFITNLHDSIVFYHDDTKVYQNNEVTPFKEYQFMQCLHNGMLLGNVFATHTNPHKSTSVAVVKTFVSKDMYFEEQTELVENMPSLLKPLFLEHNNPVAFT